jgi:hypothetical protein
MVLCPKKKPRPQEATRVCYQNRQQIASPDSQLFGKLSPRFSRPLGRFVEQMLYGILVSKDVKLSRIGRALEEPISLKKTEDRLSTNLNGDGLAGILLDQIARLGNRRVQKDALLILGATGGAHPLYVSDCDAALYQVSGPAQDGSGILARKCVPSPCRHASDSRPLVNSGDRRQAKPGRHPAKQPGRHPAKQLG